MRVMPRAVLLMVLGGMWFLGACSSGQDDAPSGLSAGDGDPPAQSATPEVPSDATTEPGESGTDGADEGSDPSTGPGDSATDGGDVDVPRNADIDELMGNLAAEQAVDVAEVELIDSGPVTWPDGSLGCPEPGHMYTQALVDGSHVVLAIDDTEYHFHAGPDGDLFYCDHPTNPVGSEATTE